MKEERINQVYQKYKRKEGVVFFKILEPDEEETKKAINIFTNIYYTEPKIAKISIKETPDLICTYYIDLLTEKKIISSIAVKQR